MLTTVALTSVQEFMVKMEVKPDPNLWFDLVKEELEEFEEARKNFWAAPSLTTEEGRATWKEAADLIYVAAGYAISLNELMFLDIVVRDVLSVMHDKRVLLDVFKLVHESNMSKLGEDGKPIKSEDGKVLKGPNYKEPNLEKLMEKYDLES